MGNKLLILAIAMLFIIPSIANATVEYELDFSKLNSTNLYDINWTSTTAEVDLYNNMTSVGYVQACRHENEPAAPSMWVLSAGGEVTSTHTFDEYTNGMRSTSSGGGKATCSLGDGVLTGFILNKKYNSAGTASQATFGMTDDTTYTASAGLKGDDVFIRNGVANTKIKVADDNSTFVYAMLDTVKEIEYARNFSGTGGEAGNSEERATGALATPTKWRVDSSANSVDLIVFRIRGWLSTASKNLSLNVLEIYPNMTTTGSALIVNVTAGRGDEVRVNISCDNRVTWADGSVNTSITCTGSTNKPIVRLQLNNTAGVGNISKVQISAGVASDTTSPGINITNFNATTKKNNLLNISCQSFDTATTGNITFNLTGNADLYNFSFALSGTSANYSQNITMNLTRGNVVNSTCWAYDSANNGAQNSTLITIADTIPTFTLVNNNTNARINESVQINVSSNDVDFLSMIIASWNGSSTGTWINISNITLDSISTANYSVNVSVLLTRGNTIGWLFYANDSVISTFTSSSLNTFVVADTLGSLEQTSNATEVRINSVINITGRVTDIDNDTAFGMVGHNQSGKMVNTTFNGLGQGTRFNFSQAITITLTRGNVINLTTFYNDTIGTLVQGTSIKITVNDTPIIHNNFTNTSDLTYNKNQTINWSITDADVPPDSVTCDVYFEALNPPTVLIHDDIPDYNFTTNMTTDGKYFANVTCQSNSVAAYSNIFNISLDVTTSTMEGFPPNGTFYKNSTNISLTLTDNLQLFEGNTSLLSLSGTLLNTTNKTNISSTSYILNLSLNVSETSDGQYNLTAWVTDTKNKKRPMTHYKVGTSSDNRTLQFNNSNTGLQCNISYGTTNPAEKKFLPIAANVSLKMNVSYVDDDYYKIAYNVVAPNTGFISATKFLCNQQIIEVNDNLAGHLLIGTGKDRLSYDAQDLINSGFTIETKLDEDDNKFFQTIKKSGIVEGAVVSYG